MCESTTWVAIDDDKMNLTVAVLHGASEREALVSRIPNEDRALARWHRRLLREAGENEIRICYEAGPNGFALMRRIQRLGPVIVEVVAPSLTPRRSGQRVKTDPIDAARLVHLYRSGELKPIAVPDEESEATRDLVRTYHQVGVEVTRKRHHILKFLVRRGRIYRAGAHWTAKHRAWLQAQAFEAWQDTFSFEELLSGLRELEDRRARLLVAMEKVAQDSERAFEVGVLRCFRGIDTTMALTLVTEVFDVQRFCHPRELMSYVGLTPRVYQSGSRDTRGPISKAGNRFARWALGQIAKKYRHRPAVGAALQRRRRGQPAWAVQIADRAQKRLHDRYWALLAREMPPSKASTAVARELVAFIWEALIEARRRPAEQAA
jgi:transposase